MTFIHFVTGKSSGILSDILSGILSGIPSGISSGILSGISSGILPGISSGILSGKSSGILSGKHSGTLSGIPSGIPSGILSGISSGILPGISSGISSGILSGILSGISSGILSGRWGPAVHTELGRSQVEVQRCRLSWEGPRLRSSGAHWARKVPGWGPAVHTELGRSQVEVQRCTLSWEGPRLRSSGAHWAGKVPGWGPAVHTELGRSQVEVRKLAKSLAKSWQGGSGGGGWCRHGRGETGGGGLIKSNNPHLAGGEKRFLYWKKMFLAWVANNPFPLFYHLTCPPPLDPTLPCPAALEWRLNRWLVQPERPSSIPIAVGHRAMLVVVLSHSSLKYLHFCYPLLVQTKAISSSIGLFHVGFLLIFPFLYLQDNSTTLFADGSRLHGDVRSHLHTSARSLRNS